LIKHEADQMHRGTCPKGRPPGDKRRKKKRAKKGRPRNEGERNPEHEYKKKDRRGTIWVGLETKKMQGICERNSREVA